MSDEDVKATQDRGFECENMDQTFMTYPDDSFDFFVRHCLEHSTFIYDTWRIPEFKPGGKVYIEMPNPIIAD